MVADIIAGSIAGAGLAGSIHCLRIAWFLWTYKPTPADDERWERRRRDRAAVRFLQTGKF